MRKLSVILIILLIFLSSCGIPSLRDFSSTVSFSASSYDKSFTLKFNSTAVNASYFTNGMVNSSSPSVILLYTVTNTSEDKVASSFRSTFNKEARGGGSYINGVPLTVRQNDGLLETKYSDSTYKLYPLIPEGRTIAPPAYTLSNDEDYTFSSLTTQSVKFSFDIEKTEGTEEGYTLWLYRNNEKYLMLTRYNGENFNADGSGIDYYDFTDGSVTSSYYIHIYAAVNVTKSRSSDFSNDYWTELKSVGNIKIDDNQS